MFKKPFGALCRYPVFVIALLAGAPSAPAVAASWDTWLQDQSKKILEDTKKAIEEYSQPSKDGDPPPEVQGQDQGQGIAAPSPQQIPQQPLVQPAEAPRFDKPWVIEIQTLLTKLGYNPGPADGAFGNKSQTAITAFQQQRGDPVTGLPTPSVMQALRSEPQQKIIAAGPSPTAGSGTSTEMLAAAPIATDQPSFAPSASTPISQIKKIDQADLHKGAFPLAPYLPNNLAHSDAVIAVCGGTRDPMIR